MALLVGILLNGLAVGSMYAMGTISLSMIWGSLGMLNLAHGAILSLGAYASFLMVVSVGLPWWAGVVPAAAIGALAGLALYGGIVRWLYAKPNFAINTVIATIALSALVQNAINVTLGAEAHLQPFSFDGSFHAAGVAIRWQPFVVLLSACAMTTLISVLLSRTTAGRAIRAVSQQCDAAALMGVSVSTVYIQIMMIAGVVSAVSGLLLTGMTTIYPTVGADPTIKALIICCVAGLGSLWGATGMALLFGLIEVAVQYLIGARFGFTITLALSICILVWRPYGLFGSATGARL